MHVNVKRTAVSGLLMALSVVLIILSGIFDFNTLFFLAAAAFLVGVIVREYGVGAGAAFFAGCLLLGFILAPQKLYCVTYAMMGIYVLAVEFLWQLLGKHPVWKGRKKIFLLGKVLIFNIMYIPALVFFPQLLFEGGVPDKMLLLFILGGQAALFVFDRTYDYFLVYMWVPLRNKIFKETK